jgi:hypothetical protein
MSPVRRIEIFLICADDFTKFSLKTFWPPRWLPYLCPRVRTYSGLTAQLGRLSRL